jgi:lipoprotein-anchoring transpeptidase ErfK/SrfK
MLWVAPVCLDGGGDRRAVVAAGCGSSRRARRRAIRYEAAGLGLRPPVLGGLCVERDRVVRSARGRSGACRSTSQAPAGHERGGVGARRPVAVYRSLTARRPERRFPVHNQFGITQVFLVKRAIPGWLEVYLPVRPNDSTGWMRSSSVQLTLDPYRVVVDTARHELTTLRAGRVVMHATVGVGKSATPTPHGLVLRHRGAEDGAGRPGRTGPTRSGSRHIPTCSRRSEPVDAQIALHGTDEPASIGQNWSNGCVHLPDSVADQLARTLPLGTPVEIS